MRASVAKALRRQAQAATVGAPAKAYLSRQHVRTKEIPLRDKDDKLVREPVTKKVVTKTIKVTSEEIRLDVNSTHGTYKALKRQLRRA